MKKLTCLIGATVLLTLLHWPCLAAEPSAASREQTFHARWVEEAFGASAATPLAPASLQVIREDAPGDTKIDVATAGGPIRLGEKTYARGIGVNSYSILRFALGQPAARFRAEIGLDRNVDNTPASVAFHVVVAGKEVFATEVLRPKGEVRTIDVALNGAREFDLVVDDGGDGRNYDQADWADARVILQDGEEVWLDDPARQAVVGTGLPCSFVYHGRPSSELLPTWKRAATDKTLDATRRQRELTLTDPDTGLEVRAVATLYLDTPAVDWTVYFTNRGTTDTPILEQVQAVDLSVGTGSVTQPPVLHRLHPDHGNFLPLDQPLPKGQRVEFAPVDGRSSLGAFPFFNLQWNGGGVITAIGWTGQWKAAVEHGKQGLRLTAGMQDLRLKLHPGETIRMPRILQCFWSGDDLEESYNQFRRVMFAHVMPRVQGQSQPVAPPIAHLSTGFYECDKGTEADVLAHLASLQGLGFEYFWLDAYYGKDNFPTVGNYVFPLLRGFNQQRFPRGIRPIGEAVHQAGLKFLMWFEPERICPGTLVAQEHPEWVVLPKDGPWGMFNLGIPEAREYVFRYLDESIKEYGIECLRIDNAVAYRGLWEQIDQPERRGISEIRYVEGLYKLWDDLLAAHPGLFIDNCASGGGRIDLETCSRSIPLWRTDGTIVPLLEKRFEQSAAQNQAMTAGLSRFVPFSTSGQMGATPYLFRSGLNGGGISFGEDVRPADYPRELLKQAIAEAKRLRPYFYGDYYPLTPVTVQSDDWCIVQYHRSAEQDGMVMLFRRPKSCFASYVLRQLRQVEPDAVYEVTESLGYEASPPVRMKGSELLQWKCDIDEAPGSMVVEYRRVK